MIKINFIKTVQAFLLLCTVNFIYAQNDKALYRIDGGAVEELMKLYKLPSVYAVENYQNIRQTKVKVNKQSEKYLSLQNEIAQIEGKKAKIEAEHNLALEKKNDIKQIINDINSFSSSSKPYEFKKSILKSAQLKAQKHHLNELIYADANFNAPKKSKFLILSLNKMDLKVHLKRVVWALEKKNVVAPEKPFFDDTKLVRLKEELSHTKSFYTENKKGKSIQENITEVHHKLKSLRELSGDYKDLGVHYVVMKDYKGKLKEFQIVNASDLSKLKISLTEIKSLKRRLIKSTSSGAHYVIDHDFLKKYARKH